MKYKALIISLLALVILQACSKDETNEGPNSINKIVNKQPTGSSANDILSDNKFKSIVIELAYIEGYKPTANAIEYFQDFVNSTSYKPGGITIVENAIPSLGNSEYTIEEIADIEEANRTKYNIGDAITIWVFFVDGKSDKDTNESVVLGTAYRNTSFVIFEETVRSFSDGPFEPNRSLLEATVVNHEFGHLLGLVNFGSDMQMPHEDSEHNRHCDEESCLMYWEAVSTSGFNNIMNTNAPPQLDAQCLADLQANGGK
ncbi:membrane metalloprotease [Flavobacteriaceae bacterium XHP0103]|uniref:membrane metalloprotease n=1 Tax=Marixanthotalea marina TaxID=2844359 RepID=UPI002989D031|nr:membrane metalloprotease [Marixanthotalea marina]MBU3822670.1 membrane metalloprotease [Marixanthotalea marina]